MNAAPVVLVAFVLVLAEPAQGQQLPVMPPNLAAGLLVRFDDSALKLEQLAEAIPAEKYTWRPMAGARSVSEALIHVAMGNYYTTDNVGIKRPSNLPDNAERVVIQKPQVLDFIKRSNSHMRAALKALSVDDLGKPARMFEQRTTYGNVYLFGVGHLHEHLGQIVAYARMIGVAPPWSARP